MRRRPVDGVCIAALVTALLGLSIVAIVLGVIGRRRTKGRLDLGGHQMATVAFYIGVFSLVLEVFILIGVLVYVAQQGA